MADYIHELDEDEDDAATPPGQLSANGHWLFGSMFGALLLAGLAFGVWAGAAKPKVIEVAQATPKGEAGPNQHPTPQPQPPQVKEPDPINKEPTVKPPTPEPIKKEAKPEPKPTPVPIKKEPPPPPKVTVKPVGFAQVKPILMGYCGNCHGLVGKPKGGIDLRTIASIMKGGDNGEILKVGDPKKSTLYTSLSPDASVPMPPDGKPGPNEKEQQLIHDWILTGAKERRRTVRGRRQPLLARKRKGY